MPLTSNLKLSEKQESDLGTYLEKRIKSLRSQNEERIQADRSSWDAYLNEVAQRAADPDSIFAQSNLPVPLTSLVVEHFVSRTEDEITGSAPFFRFDTDSPSMGRAVKDYDRFFNYKLEQAKTREDLAETYVAAYVQRALFLKAIYAEDPIRWQEREDNRALYNTQTGEFEEVNGKPIPEAHSEWVESPVLPGRRRADRDGEIVVEPTLVLAEDPTFVFDPDAHEWRDYDGAFTFEETTYAGPRTVNVDSSRILVPLDLPKFDQTDIVVEFYDKPMSWAEKHWLKRPRLSFADFKGRVQETATKEASKDAGKGVGETDTEDLDFDDQDPSITVYEVWLRRDVLGLGEPQDIVAFYHKDSGTFLYYEFVAHVTPDKKFPYSACSLGKSKDSWCGKSLVETLKPFQGYIDRQFNSQSFRNDLASNPIIGYHEDAAEEDEDVEDVFPGKKINLKTDKTVQDLYDFAVIPQVDVKTQQLIDFVFGVVQLWFGVSNLAQGDYQALAPANTATGVEATLREASKIGRRWMRRIVVVLEEHLQKLVDISIETMEQDEVYEFTDGDTRAFDLMRVSDLEAVHIKARVVLSQQQDQRALERSDAALRIQERYFAYPPELRQAARPLLEDSLRALGYADTDYYLPEVTAPTPKQLGADQPGGSPIEGNVQGSGNSNPGGRNQNTR